MFNRLKSFFRVRTSPKVVQARFDAAQTTRDNHRHWAAADHLSADMEASPEVRRTLRMRSRYEISNNSYAKGLVQMLANDTIGTGPRLQMLTSDESFNDEVETSFMRWAEAVHLPSKLRTMRMARCQDGEAFAILATNPKIRHPVKLDLTLVEADRISGELRLLEDERSVDGVYFDQWGNPVSYRVLKYHPGDVRYMPGDEAVLVPAEYMIHIFRQDRPGLHRGVPELTAALPLFAQLRRYNLAVLSAAEAAADFAAILYTDAPPNGETDEVEPMDSIPLERNMMLTVPAGWKMGQLDPKQPASNHSEFVKIILSEIARCAVVDRSFWESEVLNRIFEVWFREYLLTTMQPFMPERHTWFWDGFPHVDPGKEASAQEKRLANHTTTLAAECAKDGRDYMSVLHQRAKELKLMKQLGIPIDGEEPAKTVTEPDDGSEPKEQEIE